MLNKAGLLLINEEDWNLWLTSEKHWSHDLNGDFVFTYTINIHKPKKINTELKITQPTKHKDLRKHLKNQPLHLGLFLFVSLSNQELSSQRNTLQCFN